MISRVAESCFWLLRYVERVDNMSRLLGVNFTFLLDVPANLAERWRPLLVVTGVEEDYRERIGAKYLEDGERVQQYLVWNRDNPVSVYNSLRWARENARTIRETLSLEAWTALNRFWLWVDSEESRRLYDEERPVFYERMRESCHLFHGVCSDTLLHEEAYEFMRLGMFLERASQTARILDTKYHAVGPTRPGSESTIEAAEWIAILRSCSGYEPFFKRGDGPMSGRLVAKFLLLDPAFPRAVLHCVLRAWNFLTLIRAYDSEQDGARSAGLLVGLMTRLREAAIDDILEAGLHEELTDTVNRLAEICQAIENDYFTGKARIAAPAAEVTAHA